MTLEQHLFHTKTKHNGEFIIRGPDHHRCSCVHNIKSYSTDSPRAVNCLGQKINMLLEVNDWSA